MSSSIQTPDSGNWGQSDMIHGGSELFEVASTIEQIQIMCYKNIGGTFQPVPWESLTTEEKSVARIAMEEQLGSDLIDLDIPAPMNNHHGVPISASPQSSMPAGAEHISPSEVFYADSCYREAQESYFEGSPGPSSFNFPSYTPVYLPPVQIDYPMHPAAPPQVAHHPSHIPLPNHPANAPHVAPSHFSSVGSEIGSALKAIGSGIVSVAKFIGLGIGFLLGMRK